MSSTSDRTRRPQFWNDGFQYGFNPPPPLPYSFFFLPFKTENPFTQNQENIPKPADTYYSCGQTGH